MEPQRPYGSLNLTLSLPFLPVAVAGDHGNTDAKEDLASHIARQFSSQLASNLTSGPLNLLLEKHINRILINSNLAQTDRRVIDRVVSTLAAEFANQLVRKLPDGLEKQFGAGNEMREPTSLGTQPQTSQEFRSFIVDFIHEKKLTKMYNPQDSYIETLAQKAADQVTAKLNLPSDLTPGLVKLALYDFIILCDDSSSMNEGTRIPTLKATLRRVARFATILRPEGISVRFLNYRQYQVGTLDGLTTVEAIESKMATIKYDGGTPLGSMLDIQIIQPMIIEKAEKETLKKPVIVVIITDGEPNNEPGNTTPEVILRCKRHSALRPYGDAAVVFLIARVGDSPAAAEFVASIRRERELEGMVYCCLEDLDEKQAVFQRAKDDTGYMKWLIKLFLAALDGPPVQVNNNQSPRMVN